MKVDIPISKANRIINPGEVVLISCGYKGTTNIITLAWVMPLSHTPPLAGISIAHSHWSTEIISESREFVINVPLKHLLEKVVYCGTHSGREVDKFAQAEFTAVPAQKLIHTPLIAECAAHIECVVRDMKDAGDHRLFIAEPVAASAYQGTFKDERWAIDEVSFIYHLGGKHFTTNVLEEIN